MKISIDDIDLQDIYAFMTHGDVDKAPAEIIRYLDVLDKTNGMLLRIRQFGTRESIVKHLELTEGLSKYKASLIYAEAVEYFYRDTNISKQAWRNIYADRLDNMITAATIHAASIDDFDRISRMQARAYKMRQLDVPEPPQFPKELFEKPIKVYSMDAEFLGEDKINRNLLAQQIDEFEELSAVEKEIMKHDAAITPIKLFPNEQEDRRRQER